MPKVTGTLVASGLSSPVFRTAPPGDADRLFVVEQTGRIRTIRRATGAVVGTPFLDIAATLSTGGERGLLGLAFHPDYATNGFFYVNGTEKTTGATNIRRYTVSADPDVADPASAQLLLRVPQPFANHKGRVARQGAPPRREQGRLPRRPGAELRHPAGQPVRGHRRGAAGGVGVRAAGGVNYGWRPKEGTIPTPGVGDPIPAGVVDPFFEYTHDDGVAIIGGYVYRGSAVPGLGGTYFFADTTGPVWLLKFDGTTVTEHTERTAEVFPSGSPGGISSFGEDTAGELYLMTLNGRVLRIDAAA